VTFISQSSNELANLLDTMIDRDLSSAQTARLNAILRCDADARRFYREYLALHAVMAWDKREQASIASLQEICNTDDITLDSGASDRLSNSNLPGPSVVQLTGRVPSGRYFRQHPLQLAVASLAIVSMFWTFWAYLIYADRSDFQRRPKDSAMATVATLTAERECVWQADSRAQRPRVGRRLQTNETLLLRSGVAKITFENGAVVHLEGPARFVVQSSDKGLLERGVLLAQVPRRAIGFRIATPTLEVIDLGTEFGVQAEPQGVTEVHVVRGLVEVSHSADARPNQSPLKRVRLIAGQSLRGGVGGLESIAKESNSERFIKLLQVVRQKSRRAGPADQMVENRIDTDFSNDPGWTGVGNTSDGNDYSYRVATSIAGGGPGVGGTFARSKSRESYYGDTKLAQSFSLNDALTASGKFGVSNLQGWSDQGNSGMFIGFFSSSMAANRREFLGIVLNDRREGGGVHVTAGLGMPDGSNRPNSEGMDLPIDASYSFKITYEPYPDLTQFPGCDGRLIVTISQSGGPTQTLALDDIGSWMRLSRASFDAFGMGILPGFGTADDADLRVNIFIDDVSYSGCQAATSVKATAIDTAGSTTESVREFIVPGRKNKSQQSNWILKSN
jgi:hypothetical protein